MSHPWITDGGDDHQRWTVNPNILNKQSQAAEKRWSTSLGTEQGSNNSLPWKH